jgi:hypothetical protein
VGLFFNIILSGLTIMPNLFRKALLLAAIAPASFAAESTSVSMGGTSLIPLPRDAAQVVVGNPAVADVTMQSPRTLVLFGKYPGGTSLLVVDHTGKAILNTSVMVTAIDAEGVTIRYGTGKNWSPGGAVASAACGPDRCAPATPLAPPANSSSTSTVTATTSTASLPAAPQLQQQH